MSLWSILAGCQGSIRDGPAGLIGLTSIRKPEDTLFFTAAEGWGALRRHNQQSKRLEARHGKLRVSSLIFDVIEAANASGKGGLAPSAETCEVPKNRGGTVPVPLSCGSAGNRPARRNSSLYPFGPPDPHSPEGAGDP